MSNAYSDRNRRELQHLRSVVGRLTDAQMSAPAGGPGWTVSGIVAHIAFWDQRALVLARRWTSGGTGSPPGDVDLLNDAMKPFLLAVPPRKAAELALDAAQAIDKEIDSFGRELLSRVEANGQPKLDRGAHRAHHLEQIEKALQ